MIWIDKYVEGHWKIFFFLGENNPEESRESRPAGQEPNSGPPKEWTDIMDLIPIWEGTSHSATEEFPRILWKPNAHYRDDKTSQMVPILIETNPVHIIITYFSKIHFNIIRSPTSRFSQVVRNVNSKWNDNGWLMVYFFNGSTALVGPGLFPLFYLFTIDRTRCTSDQHVARPLPKHRTAQTQNKHI
jgi:hypothetical protein